ncbi:Calreticulin-like [Oopsacas minuta]|uniref:Calreticulin n=1 Tax=Oopsacas minuta TaxID=111878 RepID=A0AAV7JLX3_9METZ|nr:Calreticulin-like [Oopsacas minuta]
MYCITVCMVIAGLIALSAGETVYLKETFSEGWEDRWVKSTKKGSDVGEWIWTAGKYYDDSEDKGIQTGEDARFYGISAEFPDGAFSNEDTTLVIQFQVKHEQSIDCGGGYVKLWPSTLVQKDMHGDSPYNIMFGPDICGPSTKKVHVIFNYKGENLLIKKEIRCKDDVFSHVYTLILNSDNTYEVKIDNSKVESGKLEDDWSFLKPMKIKDPEAKKPANWDDKKKIDDPSDEKPEDWDEPANIPDPDATKPEDWDDDTDGDWEAPMIDNPDYKGEWTPKQIDNPNYQGEWIHPEIDNPDYEPDEFLYKYSDFGSIGLDIWQVKSGSIFDNVLVTDSPELAEEFYKETFEKLSKGEKAMKDKHDEEEAASRKQAEEMRKSEEVDDDTDTDATDSDTDTDRITDDDTSGTDPDTDSDVDRITDDDTSGTDPDTDSDVEQTREKDEF